MTERGEPPSERGEAEPASPRPRIWLASLSDYNAGRLHGAWLDAATDVDELQAGLDAMLSASPVPRAEEWAIFDYEGFGPLRLGEYERLEDVARLARGIVEHGPAFAHFAAVLDRAEWDQLEHFEEHYRGHWESMAAFAENELEEYGLDSHDIGPDWLRPYITIDFAAFGRDLVMDLLTSEGDGGVYVFEP